MIITKMVVCLLVAIALGFLFGWLIKRAFANEKYKPMIEDLEITLAQSKEALKKSEDESELIKEQFLTTQNELETSSQKVTKLQDDIVGKESHIKEIQQVSNLLHTKLDNNNKELETVTKKSHNQEEEMHRVKEHHTLLQEQVSNLTQEQSAKHQELDNLSIMIDDYKTNETKLLDEKKAQEGKVTELQATLNEKNIAALELNNKVKEIDNLHIMISDYKANETKLLDEKKAQEGKVTELQATLNEKNIAALELDNKIKEIDILNQKNSELSENLKQAQESTQKYKNSLKDFGKRVAENKSVTPQEVGHTIKNDTDEGFFDKLEHSVKENISDKLNTSTSTLKSKNDNFNFMKFAKKTLGKITETGDDINAKADKVIQEYKDRK